MKQEKKIGRLLVSMIVTIAITMPGIAFGESGKWMSGDFHQHTFYTDGSTPFDFVMERSNEFGLDWWANSEHGGSRNRDGEGVSWLNISKYPINPILGDNAASGNMWRWQSLRDFAFPDVLRNRALYSNKKIFSGLEWNVPGHEHCSTAIVADDADAISAFEFQFDKSDRDKSRIGEVTPYGTLTKMNGRTPDQSAAKSDGNVRHLDAVAGCGWMQYQYDAGTIDNGWIIFAHIERAGAFRTGSSDGGYNIEHFRDFNNAGPDVCYGFEGAPGHQVNYEGRGGFSPISSAGNGTYGGVGYYSAKVGGLWDALLGEGRRWFNYASSDYHKHWTNCDNPADIATCGDDFFPGEYQRTWVYAVDKDSDGEYSLNEIADGLRSGNAYFVHGDLINHLEFEAQNKNVKAGMGGELVSKGAIKNLKLKIRFKSPSSNNHGDRPVVDHIDLIAGTISGRVIPGTPAYSEINSDAKVVASFRSHSWETDKQGYSVIVHHLKDVDKSTFFRLRGTNLACDTANETGPAVELPSADYCNPLPDSLIDTSAGPAAQAEAAWKDLWFYSNPIFVYVE